MKVLQPSREILTKYDGIELLKRIEAHGRLCYKSEDKITDTSYQDFIKKVVLTNHHESIIEHEYITVKFNTDKGVSHEIVRHRLASFTQTSTRYCNYSKGKFGTEIEVMNILTHLKNPLKSLNIWYTAMKNAENSYMQMIEAGEPPEIARSVLPSSLATEITVTANLREWRHILQLRTSPKAHPQMRELMVPLLNTFKATIPLLFDDIPS